MNVNGPWCFIQDEDIITMEQCDVCQSLGKSLLRYLSRLSFGLFFCSTKINLTD
jgi:hypothetical protein